MNEFEQLSTLLGMRVIEVPEHPRYTLPEEVILGVPWPEGFRDEINKWSVDFLGTTSLIPRDTQHEKGER